MVGSQVFMVVNVSHISWITSCSLVGGVHRWWGILPPSLP